MQSKLERRLKANRVAGFVYFRDHYGSEPGKHSWDLCGRPVYYWTLRAALECKYLEKILVWTEVEEALNMARKMSDKFIVVKRKLSECVEPEFTEIDDLRTPQSEKSIYSGIHRFAWTSGFWGREAEDVFGFIPSAIMDLCACAPLAIGSDFDRLVEAYFSVDGVQTAEFVQMIESPVLIKTGEYGQRLWGIGMPRQQTIPKLYILTGGRLVGINKGIYYRRWNTALVEIPQERSVDIHSKEDLVLAEFYLKRRLIK